MQSTIPDTTTCLLRSAMAVFVGIIAIAFVSLLTDLLSSALDAGIPWRQLTLNRTLSGLALSCKLFCAILCSHAAAVLLEMHNRRLRRIENER